MNQITEATHAYTTLKEYDAAVRRSQRKIKDLTERLEGNPLDSSARTLLDLAKAGHKFLLACRAKFKEGPVPGDKLDALAQALGVKRTEASQPFDKAAELEAIRVHGVDPASPEPGVMVYRDETGQLRAKPTRVPNAAEPQAPLPRDRKRDFVPRAQVIRERVNAGPGARAPRFAPDDSRSQGLGYRVNQRRAKELTRVMAFGVTPKRPSERYPSQRLGTGKTRITVNGATWGA